MRVLGISALDKDSTACVLEDGVVKYVIAEERLSRIKMHAGFPRRSVGLIFELMHITPEDIDYVAYPFFGWQEESRLRLKNLLGFLKNSPYQGSAQAFKELKKVVTDCYEGMSVYGLPPEKWKTHKALWKRLIYYLGGGNFFGDFVMGILLEILGTFVGFRGHYNYHQELERNLEKMNLLQKLVRVDHHRAHAANAFYGSGFEEALIVTLDGYGSGLAGSISTGIGKTIERIHALHYPNSLGTFYESVTSATGFKPSRHEGKIVGLAAYGDPDRLTPAIRARFAERRGDFFYRSPANYFFHRYLSTRYTKMTMAAAYQRTLEHITVDYVKHYLQLTKMKNVALSGGVIANVKNNQRIFEIPGVENIFIHPNMGDGGTGVGAALLLFKESAKNFSKIKDVYWGPAYSDDKIAEALQEEGVHCERPSDLEATCARLINDGKIVARFDGRMEYGPRALGARSVLYHAREPEVNQWLNHQLGRTEFMPFAPVTLYEYRHEYYKNIDGAENPAEFMTLTFDCTEKMIRECPAAVHIDGTARPQLIKKEVNPSYYRIIDEYRKLTGIPTLINTSFNMHEEPIVCSPHDAIRAFKLGHLHYLAIGPYLAKGDSGA